MRVYKRIGVFISLVFMAVVITGCAGKRELAQMNERQSQMIYSLTDEINRLNNDVQHISKSADYLEKTKNLLQARLKEELEKGNLKVDVNEKGIVVTVLNKILFDSGKTDLKTSSMQTLGMVGSALVSDVPDQMIYVEGHTDNDPIVKSNFKSNWELSVLRATEVVHYFVENVAIDPRRIVAVGCGEHQPIASNDTREGKALNRRVEIIISPQSFLRQTSGV